MERVIKDGEKKVTVEGVNQLVGQDQVNKYGGEVFRVLCGLTGGEANSVVRGAAVQVGGRTNGFLALKLLSNRFSPRTPTRLYQSLLEVLTPTTIRDAREVPRREEEWELRCARLRAEFGQDGELAGGIKVAVLIGMVPKDLQEVIFHMGTAEAELEYQAVRDRVVSVAGQRAARSVPKEEARVQGVDWDCGIDGQEEWGGEDQCGECGIDALGKGWTSTTCHRCGGKGHFARECSTPAGTVDAGKGKAGKAGGNGKGGEKGGWGKGGEWSGKGGVGKRGGGDWFGKGGGTYKEKGKGSENGKGWGKGYQGKCYRCWEIGHKANEGLCWAGRAQGVSNAEGQEEQTVELGSVWAVCQVEKMEDMGKLTGEEESGEEWQKSEGRKRKGRPRRKGKAEVTRLGTASWEKNLGRRAQVARGRQQGDRNGGRREVQDRNDVPGLRGGEGIGSGLKNGRKRKSGGIRTRWRIHRAYQNREEGKDEKERRLVCVGCDAERKWAGGGDGGFRGGGIGVPSMVGGGV